MKRIVAGFLFSITVLVFTTALGLAVIHISGFPYVIDIGLLDICEKAHLPREEVLSNYNAVMEYLSPFSNKEFSLATFRYTPKARLHFVECKALFNEVYLLGFASGIILIILMLKRAVSRKTLQLSGTITLAIPAVVGIALLTNFDRTFTFFHSIFFLASSWVFDPRTDRIISILPSEFFMHCAIIMTVFWIAGAALQLIFGYSMRKGR